MVAAGQKVLIVEDEVALMRALDEKLKREGYEVVRAGDGQEGLEVALTEHPALILLDILMPQMDGMSMLKKLREDKWGGTVPVILLTNLSDPEKMQEAIGHGVYDYLVKTDWKLKEIIAKIREKLKPKY